MRIVLILKPAQFLQTPGLVAINGFERLVAGGVVHVGRRATPWLTRVPEVPDLAGPFMSNRLLSLRGDGREESATSSWSVS